MSKKHSSFPTRFQLQKNVCCVIIWEIGGHRRQAVKAWMWTGARNKAIWSSKSTVTMKPTLARKKKCLLTYKFPGSLTKQLSFLSFPAKHVMFRGEEAESSSSFMLQNNFICPEFSFIKFQGFVPSSVLLSPFAFSSFVYNIIISTNKKNRKGKFNAESENLWNIP